jgi:putative lipase involved disintegration of autophagic bodies
MSDSATESVGTITRYAEAWANSDVAAMFGLYHDDVIAHYGGTSEFAGVHRGRDAFASVLIETVGRSGRRLLSIDQVDDHGGHGAIFATEAMTVLGEEVHLMRALRYRVENAQIVECWLFDHDQHHVDRAWQQPTGS